MAVGDYHIRFQMSPVSESEHNNAPVEVAIRDVQSRGAFSSRVHPPGGLPEKTGIRVFHYPRVSAARQQDVQSSRIGFPVAGKLDCLPVLGAIAGNPDVAGLIGEYAVLRHWPVITRARSSPGFKEVPFAVKYQDRRRGNATNGNWDGFWARPRSSFTLDPGRWSTQMWSSLSTATPPICPMIQLLGNSFRPLCVHFIGWRVLRPCRPAKCDCEQANANPK